MISIVVFPFAYENGWGIIRDKKSQITDADQLEVRRRDIEKLTNIRTYVLGDESQEEQLVETCLSFFSGSEEWRTQCS